MARKTDVERFLEQVGNADGRITNKLLQENLGWNNEKYWRIHQQLFESGAIEKGRGYSGMVILVSEEDPIAAADVAAAEVETSDSGSLLPEPDVMREAALYAPVLKQLNENWRVRRQLDQCHGEITALQGRRETGGSWSRPDVTVVGVKKYEFLPDRLLEVFSFEVKASYDVSIKGVLEALAHREAATRSYVIYHTDGRDLGEFPEALRIEELAVRHGIGVFAAKDINDFKSWEEVTSAPRATPDPDTLDTFLKRSLSEEAKTLLRKWT